MKLLGLDTTRKNAKIYIIDNENRYVESMNENVKHSEGVFLYLEKALLSNNCLLKDFDFLCGVVGPGSFTGIRVGMSIIKGFAKSLNKKIISLNTFDIVKNYIKNGVFLLNSTINNCYFAVIKNGQVVSSGVVLKDDVFSSFTDKIFVLEEEQNLFNFSYKDINIIDNLSDLFFDAVLNKIDEDSVCEFEPYYLQLSQAEKNLNV